MRSRTRKCGQSNRHSKRALVGGSIYVIAKPQQTALDRGTAYFNKLRADHNLREDDFQRAIADLTEAIQLDPKNALAYHYRGYLYNYHS